MSEGGRKVWNREQLEALNPGAIVLARANHQRYDQQREPMEYRPDCYMAAAGPFHVFGEESHFDVADDYPLEVIWEPNE